MITAHECRDIAAGDARIVARWHSRILKAAAGGQAHPENVRTRKPGSRSKPKKRP